MANSKMVKKYKNLDRLNKNEYVVTKEDLAQVNDIYTKPSVGYSSFDDTVIISSTYETFEIDRESIWEVRKTEKSLIFCVKYGVNIEVELQGEN